MQPLQVSSFISLGMYEEASWGSSASSEMGICHFPGIKFMRDTDTSSWRGYSHIGMMRRNVVERVQSRTDGI